MNKALAISTFVFLLCFYQQSVKAWGGPKQLNSNEKDFEVSKFGGLLPEPASGYNIINTGNVSSIQAETYFCTLFGCWTIEKVDLAPFEEAYVSFGTTPRSSYHFKVSNLGSEKAEFWYSYGKMQVGPKVKNYLYPTIWPKSVGKIHNTWVDEKYSYFCNNHVSDEMTNTIVKTNIEETKIKVGKTLSSATLSLIPGAGAFLAYVPDTIFPDKQDYWESVREKVTKTIDDKLILHGLDSMERELKSLKSLMTDLWVTTKAHNFKEKVPHVQAALKKFKSERTDHHFRLLNFATLTIYSSANLAAILFITAGMSSSTLNLDAATKKDLITRCNQIFTEASTYIEEINKYFLSRAFENRENLYHEVQTVKEHFSINGFEYLNIMNYTIRMIQEGKENKPKFYNNVVSMSPLFGKKHPRLVSYAYNPRQPLSPSFLINSQGNLRHNRLVLIRCHVLRLNGAPRVAGLEIEFENKDRYNLGTQTDDNEIIKLDDPKVVIRSIEVSGCGAVDRITFYLSDGRIVTFGEDATGGPNNFFKFERPLHHIVGIMITPTSLGGQVQSLSVSYMLDEVIDL